MTGNHHGSGLAPACDEIARAVGRGQSLARVEQDIIERKPVSRDARDALWLFAWVATERMQLREWARSWPR